MNSLNIANIPSRSPEIEQILYDFIALLEKYPPTIISVPEFIKLFLKVKGKKSYILKRQRRSSNNMPDRNDSFIVGIPVDKNMLGIKIHPDTWTHCKRIYETPDLLEKLTSEHDVPEILLTRNIKGFRIVFYMWEKSPILPYHLKKYPDRIPQIQNALRERIASLGVKGLTLVCSEPSDFTYSPHR